MAQVQILYIATDRGVVQLANPGTSDRWRVVGTALAEEPVLAVAASSSDPLRAFAGSAAGLYATSNGGAGWELLRPAPVTALTAASGAVYAGTVDGTILRGSGDEWHTIGRGAAAVRRLGVLRDGRVAAVYDDASIVLLDGDSVVPSDIAVPAPLAVVSSAADPAGIFVVARSGVHTPAGFHPLDGTATGAAVLLAGKPEVLLLGTEQSTLRSEDGGGSFSIVEGPADVRMLVSTPRYQDYAYAGTGAGELWLSSDRGRTWRRLHAGMPPIHDLSFARVF